MLAVGDTGQGIDAATKARIFEPFFTTKEPGRGTGLGLSTVHGIVRQSEGQIEVITEPGHGTTFKMYFPRVDEAVEVRVEQAVSPEHCEGNEVVLVVDDEDAIRRVIRDSLEPLGYRVIDAADGKEALAMCARREQPIDLLITDIVMPLMTGPQLVNRLTRRWPGVRVLFISGYMDRALVHQGMRAAGTAFLQKPFSPSVLARGVRKVLDEPREAAA
jgi:two-component system cell cycle sensor histidine kinase/response regulator CckA